MYQYMTVTLRVVNKSPKFTDELVTCAWKHVLRLKFVLTEID